MLPLPTGNRMDGALNNAGSDGDYWSSSLTIEDPDYYDVFGPRGAVSLYFYSGNAYTHSDYRYCGKSVRPVRTKNAPTPSSVRALIQEMAALITSNNGIVTVSCQAEGLPISVYSVNGQLLGTSTISSGRAFITTQLRSGDIALVKIGSKTVKVVIK